MPPEAVAHMCLTFWPRARSAGPFSFVNAIVVRRAAL